MSDTDIYKKREPMPLGGNRPPKNKNRRRRSDPGAFDEERTRKRRSKNSGIRRLLHLSRKSENEKFFWGSMGSVALVILIVLAIWQFVILEMMARSEDQKDDYMQQPKRIPQAESPMPGSAAE